MAESHTHDCHECGDTCRLDCICDTPEAERCCVTCASLIEHEDEHNTNALYAH